MRKLSLALAVAMVAMGFLAWNAQATPLIPTPAQHYSPIEKVACGGPGARCAWGRTWVCGPAGCWCRPCGRYWRY